MTASSRGCGRAAARLLTSLRASSSRGRPSSPPSKPPLRNPSSSTKNASTSVSPCPSLNTSISRTTPPAEAAWKKYRKERNGVAGRDLGGYQAYGEERWHDEVLVGSDLAEPDKVREKLVKEAVGGDETSGEEVEGIEIFPRETEADRKGDQRSLERRLAETLYLVVKGGREGENAWGFPRGEIVGREMLHTAAERILRQTAGTNMNTWIVGYVPIGFSTIEPSEKFSRKGEKVFFMKGRIMAGQANLKGNEMGVSDWKWVTKGELQGLVTPRYWSQVRGMLADR
ncbi:hypothetical protein ACMFMF_007412 [Clarireedia jacksonii]